MTCLRLNNLSCITTTSIGVPGGGDLATALNAKLTTPGSPDAGLPLVYDATDLIWETEQLAAAGLADDAVIARTIADGVIIPAHMDEAITQAQWRAVFGITSPTGLPSGANAGNWLTYKDGTAEWADLPSASGSQAGIIHPAEYAKINAAIDGATLHNTPMVANQHIAGADAVLFDDASVSVGSQLREITFDQLDERWVNEGDAAGGSLSSVAHDDTLQGSGTSSSELRVTTPLNKVGSDFIHHGLEGDGQTQQSGLIAQHLGDKPNASQLEDYTYTTFYDPGPRYTDEWIGIRIPIADKARVDHYEVYVSESDGGNRYAVYTGDTWEWIADSNGYARYTLEIADKPSGQGLSVWKYQKLGIDGDDVAIDYNKLDNLPPQHDGRELIQGNITGVVVTGLNANSAVSRTNLTEQLNIQTEPHGVLLSLLTPTPTGFTATDIRFSQSEYDGETTIESVARAPPYATTTSSFGRTLVYADLMKGPTAAGRVVVKLAHDASGDTFLTAQYLATRGHSLADSGSITLQLELFILSSGAPRGVGGGQYFEFTSKPDAADFTDGDLIIVTQGL